MEHEKVGAALLNLFNSMPNEVCIYFCNQLSLKSDTGEISGKDESNLVGVKQFEAFRDEIRKRELSNTENYDKTILSLSSSGLALSLTAIHYVVPLGSANNICILKFGWILFGLTILLSIVAYWVSNKALNMQLEPARQYYMDGVDNVFEKRNLWSSINNMINFLSGVSFLVATASIIFFVMVNI